VGGQQFELRQYPLSSSLCYQSKSGFSTNCLFPYFLSKSLNASMARALIVVSRSTASIRSARQPSTPIRVRTCLNASGLPLAVGPVLFGLRPIW